MGPRVFQNKKIPTNMILTFIKIDFRLDPSLATQKLTLTFTPLQGLQNNNTMKKRWGYKSISYVIPPYSKYRSNAL